MEPRTDQQDDRLKTKPHNKKALKPKEKQQLLKPKQKFNIFTTSGNNQIWLGGLDLAWKQLVEKQGFKPQIRQGARAVPAMISQFTGNACSVDDIDRSIYFKGGLHKQTIRNINEELKERFASQFNIPKVQDIKDNEAILYGALYKKIRLQYPLFKIPGKIMHFCGLKVPCYEPMQRQQRQQIFVVKYSNQDNFILRINLIEKDSYMFVYRSKQKVDIDTVIQTVCNVKDDINPLTQEDVFKIPQFKFRVSKFVSQIVGLKGQIQTESQQVVQIADCYQAVDLQFVGQPHRQRMDILVLSIPEQQKPTLQSRRMAVRGPFWFVLKLKNKYPYFIMHVTKYLQEDK